MSCLIKELQVDDNKITSDVEVQEIKNEEEQGEWRQVYKKDSNGNLIGGAYEYKWFKKGIEKQNIAYHRGTTGFDIRVVCNVKTTKTGKAKKLSIKIHLDALKNIVDKLEEEYQMGSIYPK